MIQIAIIQFPGSNCERETRLAIERAEMQAVDVMWNASAFLEHFDGFVLIGGFSYEDRCRSGLIASKDPLMNKIAEQAKLGKPVLGICNGAQILVESGLVPGLANQRIGMALTHNKRLKQGKVLGTGFYNNWCYIKSKANKHSVFSRHYSGPLNIPLAHGEGRFIIPDEVWKALSQSPAEVWQYCDSMAEVIDEFPVNPNGSAHNIAGISNASGNVLALMPHPERTKNGDAIFSSMRDYIKEQRYLKYEELQLELKLPEIKHYSLAPGHRELNVQMLINDNEAISLQKALQDMGMPVKVEKFVHWNFNSDASFEEIAASNELFQPNKEHCVEIKLKDKEMAFLVEEKEDMLAQAKLQSLQSQIPIKALSRGVLWKVSAEKNIKEIAETLISRCILFNPYAHHCSYYPSYRGKVRDIYNLGEELLLVSTDRLSAFDRHIASVPNKGRVLNQLSAWWFNKTKAIIDNHFIAMPSSTGMKVKKCRVFPIEVIVRGYLTGSTQTSIWSFYSQGQRQFFKSTLPEGLSKNSKLDQAIVTPSSKSASHDQPLSLADIENADYISQEQWGYIEKKAIELFNFASKIAYDKGLILVDTKFEFGQDDSGHIILVDECLTPDSSRYWRLGTYKERVGRGLEPESFDKEIIRLWYKEHCDPYEDKVIPEAPEKLIDEVASRYIEVYEKLTSQKLD
jgi:phosphoribosylformylglycinamidine synthase